MNIDYTSNKNQLSSRVGKISQFRKIHQDLIRIAQSITDVYGYEDGVFVTDEGQLNMRQLLGLARNGLWNDTAIKWLHVAAIATITKPEGTEIVTTWNEDAAKYPNYFLFIHSNAYIPESSMGPALSHQTAIIARVVDGYIVNVIAADYARMASVELYPFILKDTLEALAPTALIADGAELVIANNEWDMNSKSTLEIPLMILRSQTNLQQYESIFQSIQIMDLGGLCQTWTLAAGSLLIHAILSTDSDSVMPLFIQLYRQQFTINEGMDSHVTIFSFLRTILTKYTVQNNITVRKSPMRRTSDGDVQMIDRDTGEVSVKYRNNRDRMNVSPKPTPYRRRSLDNALRQRKRKRENDTSLRSGWDSRPSKRRN